MYPDDNVRITFYSEADGDKSAKVLFAYVLLKANEYNYFNPKYSNGELYDIFEDLMAVHCEYSDEIFDTSDSAKNMENFFNADKHLDDERKEVVDETFEKNVLVSDYLMNENLSGDVSVEFNADINMSGIVLTLPISSNDFMDRFSMNEEDTTSELPFLNNHHQQPDEMLSSDEFGGILDNQRVTAPNQQVTPERVFNRIAETLKTQTERLPVVFIPFNTRLHGINEDMMLSIQNKIIAIVDIIAFLNNYTYEPHWTDIFEFAYNMEGQSLDDLTEYVSEQHLLLVTDSKDFTKYYDEVLFLQKHLVELSKKKGQTNIQPLPAESQHLLAFVDYISQACSLEEGGFFG